jgi:hypothetical protein
MIMGALVEWRCVDPGYPESRGDWRGDDPAEPPALALAFDPEEIDLDDQEIERRILEAL